MPEYHLGISAFYHDSAAALVCDGIPVAAAQQERFSRIRHDSGFPADAIRYCLQEAGITFDDLTSVSYYENPKMKFRRVLDSFAHAGPKGFDSFMRVIPQWLQWKYQVLDKVDLQLKALALGTAPPAQANDHHRSHAASAFFPSPFENAAILCIDSVGEYHTTSVWHGQGDQLTLVNSISYPHSLGLLYSAMTYFCGFKVDSGEYKLMGLAPYGTPLYADIIKEHLIFLREDGSFSLNLTYFEFMFGKQMVGEKFAQLFGGPAREAESPLTQRECDLAASVQVVIEEAVMGLAQTARQLTGEENLCLAGGVALNCVSNGRLSRAGLFSEIWVQPAAGDAGCALGSALDASIKRSGRQYAHALKVSDLMQGAYLGPGFSDDEIAAFLNQHHYPFQHLPEEALLKAVSGHLSSGAVIGWFQGRMEFGPRALGARSIIGDPRNQEMQKTMNLKIKYRESFRPFAPSILQDDAKQYFEMSDDSPYMLMVSDVQKELRQTDKINRSLGSIDECRSSLPAITHVDMSARVQTVSEERNGKYARLLKQFREDSGCPVVVNTSFNVRGEPIVCTPEEAYRCFMRTEMDVLVLGNCLLLKTEQPPFEENVDWRRDIPLD
ncbi:carbamoyltransferase (plasmid) [Photobacterium sp. GJ3]|uniref:carbamoyltransferase family protein n=1 Tax=Photobacterium sp. GJ3 TaxID=2829502 RepID=UPI001B8C7396|nr:carbamoyltransferase [Photobacterium sp. GJ3]QUJ69364.1 carbamoyltransferase [Photobacterium sp. GJ3]